jgi:arylformamidase
LNNEGSQVSEITGNQREFYDLSQCIENKMAVFPGDPQPVIRPAEGVSWPWRVSELQFGSHTGTHIDAASHLIEKGTTIDRYPLERFIAKGIVLPLDGLEPGQAIEAERLAPILGTIPKGGAILLCTGWDRYWAQELYLHHPYLRRDAADILASSGIGLVGIDAPNVDSTYPETQHTHEALLGRNILIVENLKGLSQLQAGEVYWFSCLPLLLCGSDGSPVRAVAWKDTPCGGVNPDSHPEKEAWRD